MSQVIESNRSPATPASASAARRWRIGGRVQGVGFRPFVYRLAHLYELTGWVRNTGGEVEIHGEGTPDRLEVFGRALLSRAPPAATARLLEMRPAEGECRDEFLILASTASAEPRIHVPADLFTCDECLAELRDPTARRHGYPFINCTQCGPRYTLIRAMPYDRQRTALERFALCPDCTAEYTDPLDRRFHAEPLACSACGPALYWHGLSHVAGNDSSLAAALASLCNGQIIAVRGVGGYHLLCDARDENAVARLRLRKGRPAKPLAVMLPWRGADGLDDARLLADLLPSEAEALRGAVRPIVLVRRNPLAPLAQSIAPGLREVGVMMPYSPLHYLLLERFDGPLVATSGNLSGEPVLTEPHAAEARLAGVADGFLHHDRPIIRPAEDPVVRVVAGALRPLRLGRGTAPLEFELSRPVQVPLLAVGAHQKTTVALAWGARAVVSPHIGDLASPRGREVFAQVAHDLQALYGIRAERIVHDTHPGFANTRWARDSGLPTQAIWHHHAHASAVAGETLGAAPLLCFTWDGVGLGEDNSLWGGEALLGGPGEWTRVASMRPFRLPGGERAAREPWRSALALCWECDRAWPGGEDLGGPLLRAAWAAGFNAPSTTSVGRLFDAAAALVGCCSVSSYEGQAPTELEALCGEGGAAIDLPLDRDANGIWRSDWAPLIPALLDEDRSPSARAAVFHASLAQALCAQALVVHEQTGVTRIGLGGGVFQNRVLSDQAHRLLSAAGFEVLIPQRLPVNDAAISFGQIIEAMARDRLRGPAQ